MVHNDRGRSLESHEPISVEGFHLCKAVPDFAVDSGVFFTRLLISFQHVDLTRKSVDAEFKCFQIANLKCNVTVQEKSK